MCGSWWLLVLGRRAWKGAVVVVVEWEGDGWMVQKWGCGAAVVDVLLYWEQIGRAGRDWVRG